MTNLELKGYAQIAGVKRLANVYTNGEVYVKNYIGEFVKIENATILEYYRA